MLISIEVFLKFDVWDADRLAGATLIAPVVNYWWPGLPANLSGAYYKQPPRDQWALRVAHHIPWLIYWWNTQKLFPTSSVVSSSNPNMNIFSRQDLEIIRNANVSERDNKVLFIFGKCLGLFY